VQIKIVVFPIINYYLVELKNIMYTNVIYIFPHKYPVLIRKIVFNFASVDCSIIIIKNYFLLFFYHI